MSQKRQKKEQKRKQKKAMAAKKASVSTNKSNDALLASMTPDEKTAISRVMDGAKKKGIKVSTSDALRNLRKVRESNDEAMASIGLKRAETESGFAKFSREQS